MTKPMLATDWDEKKVRFPVFAQPKIDGVRAINLGGTLTGRSLKPHANKFTTKFYSGLDTLGFDGEMAAESETHPRLCSLTTSALNSVQGEPWVMWHLFDYVRPETIHLPYYRRLEELWARMQALPADLSILPHLTLLSPEPIGTMEVLEEYDAKCLALGYEGTIIRDPHGMHKNGRSTVREGGLLRIKRFVEEDAVVLEIIEGSSNQNEAKINELGYTERSTHAHNMVPNGMVGALLCRDVKTGATITVAAGSMTHAEREMYFKFPHMIVGQTVKYKTFPKGVKDKPRFPTFQSIRSTTDLPAK